MRAAMTALIFLASLLPAAEAAAQTGQFCDPSWCMSLDQAQRAELGGKLIKAVAALKLPFRDPLKPISIQPKGMPWQAAKLRKVPRKMRARASPMMAAPWDSGGFPHPLRFLGSFKLPKKAGKLSVQVELAPVAAGVPDLSKGEFYQLREERDDYLMWELNMSPGQLSKRFEVLTEVNLVVGTRLQGNQGVPIRGKKPDKLAPVRSVRIKLVGPRRVVDGIAKRIDIGALKELTRERVQ